jgi:hypothetical protein
MNTDNMSIAGETIDYSPCAFMDAYKRHGLQLHRIRRLPMATNHASPWNSPVRRDARAPSYRGSGDGH